MGDQQVATVIGSITSNLAGVKLEYEVKEKYWFMVTEEIRSTQFNLNIPNV